MLKIAQHRQVEVEKSYLGGIKGMQEKTGKTGRIDRVLMHIGRAAIAAKT